MSDIIDLGDLRQTVQCMAAKIAELIAENADLRARVAVLEQDVSRCTNWAPPAWGEARINVKPFNPFKDKSL